MLLPRSYVELRLERCPGGGALTVSLGPCPAVAEDDGLTWPAILAGGDDAGLAAAVHCMAPQARIERIERRADAVASWRVWLDPDAPPVVQPDEVTLTEFSTGVDFHFSRRG